MVAVLAGHARLPTWRSVDPVGLVVVDGTTYLLASHDGEDRTYRVSRVVAAEVLDEPADRTDAIDLERTWVERGVRFRAGGDTVVVIVVVAAHERDELVGTSVALLAEEARCEGRVQLRLAMQDRRHAEWVLWRLGRNVEVRSPAWLRTARRTRAADLAAHHARVDEETGT